VYVNRSRQCCSPGSVLRTSSRERSHPYHPVQSHQQSHDDGWSLLDAVRAIESRGAYYDLVASGEAHALPLELACELPNDVRVAAARTNARTLASLARARRSGDDASVDPYALVGAFGYDRDRGRFKVFKAKAIVLPPGVSIQPAGMLAMQATGYWRKVYTFLLGSRVIYAAAFLAVKLYMSGHTYTRVSFQTLPIIISFLLTGTAGVLAYSHISEEETGEFPAREPEESGQPSRENLWASRMARGALLSLPLIGFWCLKISQAPEAVHSFRLMITVGAILPLGFLAFCLDFYLEGIG